ncbi:Sodium:solute symporter family protein [Cardinium endosymbiont of Sogatella furcifera]|uniref:sodium:solute symporter family protein n=1 Tax=Cardinium endosymbiont of Sogatella furcifera TaxID=650378 RepID=UPI000E0CFCDE|nr:sodium:solute symporter family protein [Cardinium endosymbiont of Sogatella furcifera]AXI24188.1 Sodium:solute symporter family protein [Cardinium endosymbiont of Sogatella furcifera]
MVCFHMSLVIIGAFLLLTLAVGIYFSRKKTSFREHAVGNKQFATATLVATVLATAYSGGGLLRTVECVYNLGLWWIAITLITCLDAYLISKLALRMGPFMNHLSMAETIGSIYGKYPRIMVALVSVCGAIIAITMQITAMSKAITMCIDTVNPNIAAMISTLVLIFYSTFGGVRAVTYTDVLQFITFSIIIPLLAWFMFIKTGKSTVEIVSFLGGYTTKFQFSSLFGCGKKLISMVLLILSFLIGRMYPSIIQRVYMASGPIQAQKVFAHVTICSVAIWSFIILVGIFVFVGAPGLSGPEIWTYIVNNVPLVFKALLAVSLLAMAMSTADSNLNASAVMSIHDLLGHIPVSKNIAQVNQLRLAKWATLVIGLLAMILAFYCNDLLKLMYWALNCYVPIVIAPFVLAVFGFRGSSRTALIGMAAGVLTMLSWNEWVEPITSMDGSFIAMLVNALFMMVVHYLFKQPEGSGWVPPQRDDMVHQMKQETARKQAERKETIQNAWTNKKDTLAKLQPSRVTLTSLGLYVVIINVLTYFIGAITDHSGWLIAQLLVGVCFLGYSTFTEKISIPRWVMGLFCVLGLSFCLPINVLWHWWHGTNLLLTLGISLAHLSVTLLVLPLYLSVSFLVATLCIVAYLSPTYCTKTLVLSPSSIVLLLLLCLGVGLLIFSIFVYLKAKNNRYFDQVIYLKGRERFSTLHNFKAALYDAAMAPGLRVPQGQGSILAQVVGKVEESISFLDSYMPLYKQDFQSIINKLYDWVAYFNKREKAKNHALLQPIKITLDKLIRQVEVTLSQEVSHPPRLFVAPSSETPCTHIVCDIHQVVYLLVQSILRVSGQLDGSSLPVVRIHFHPTSLQFKQAEPIDERAPSVLLFQAIGLVISNDQATPASLLKVKPLYDDRLGVIGPEGKQVVPPSIDLRQDTIVSMVDAHYGYLEYPADGSQAAMLLVLPIDVAHIRDKMTTKLPLDCLTSDAPVTPKEQADSMMALMQFHDYICQSAHSNDPVDIGTISGLLLLLRQHFGFKRHASGQLFYVRAVGIATLVVDWVFHSPKVIYAALLYELVRHTCLPLSYIKQHYNLGVYAFVLNVVGIDKRQSLDHPSLLYVQNRLKAAIKEDHVQLSVLFIKLAERLYDLRHASGYVHLAEVQHMAQETLSIDVQIAHTYLGSEVGTTLEQAAKQALAVCQSKRKQSYTKKDKDR